MTPAIPAGYRLLSHGEAKQPGDLAWTWQDDQETLGWITITQADLDPGHATIDDGHVPTIRKIGA